MKERPSPRRGGGRSPSAGRGGRIYRLDAARLGEEESINGGDILLFTTGGILRASRGLTAFQCLPAQGTWRRSVRYLLFPGPLRNFRTPCVAAGVAGIMPRAPA